MQKKYLIVLLSLLSFSFIWSDQGLSSGKKDEILIVATEIADSLVELSKSNSTEKELNRLVDDLNNQLEVAVSSTRIFQIIDRKHLKELTDEHRLSDPGLISDVIPGAKYLIFPKLTAYQLNKSVSQQNALNRQSSSVIISATLLTKIVDPATGVALPDMVSITKSVTQNHDLSKSGTEVKVDMLVDSLAKQLSYETAWGLISMVRPPKVLAVAAGQVMINRGNNGGLTVGRIVKFYTVEQIKDDDTGETFDNETEIGSGEIIRSTLKQSYAKVLGENLGITKGCVVRVQNIAVKGAPQPQGRAESSFGIKPENEKKEKLSPGSSEKPW